MVKKTMHTEYGEPNDEAGKHECCEKCLYCVPCGDCKAYGCGTEKPIKRARKALNKSRSRN